MPGRVGLGEAVAPLPVDDFLSEPATLAESFMEIYSEDEARP